MQYIRRPSHAGTWFTAEGAELAAEVATHIASANGYQKALPTAETKSPVNVDGVDVSGVKALLAGTVPAVIVGLYGPHSGLVYSGNTNSHAYTLVEQIAAQRPSVYKSVKRVFLIGPTHHKPMQMEVSGASSYTLPWGKGEMSLPCDTEVLSHIQSKAREAGMDCGVMDRGTDEAEHSLEMHLPFVAKMVETVFKGVDPDGVSTVRVVPMLFGHMSASQHESMASSILGPYFNSEGPVENFFVFSTDFCHWGSRFGFTHHFEPSRYPVLGDSIKAMDLQGVRHIQGVDVDGWEGYLRATRNTICGKHPLSTMLRLARNTGDKCRLVPTHYSQSSKVKDAKGSSVSYASGVLVVDPTPQPTACK